MTNSFSEQPIIIYGGGCKLPIIDSGEILIHDNGNPSSITIPLTYLQKQKISKFSSLITIKPSDKSWDPDFPLLAVALGLSFIKPTSSAEWFNEKDYKTHDYDSTNVVAHPANEDCYVFDVINSKWV